MQNVLNSSPYTQYQPYQQYNPNYYQGKYSQYNNYNPSFYQTPQISTVNWKFINDCNAQVIEANEDIDKMNQILNLITHSDFQSDSQTNQNPNILKLLSLTQVVINYLLKCQDDLKEQNSKLQKRNSSIENAMKKNNKSSHYYKDRLIKAVAILKKSKKRERCPTCHITLQSFQELDQHMKTCHNKLLNEWICIKEGKESPLQKQIAEMQREIMELKTNQRSHYFNESANANKQKKKFEPSLFDRNNDKFLNLSSEEDATAKQQQNFQQRPQVQPQQPVQQQMPIIQNIPNQDTDNLAKLNAKKRAEDFLAHRRPATPMHPQQVDEIVHKISNMLHEQSKQVNYGEAVKEEPPEDLRKDISEDVESDHPMPETSNINNLKDLKKPLKTPKRKRTKKKEKKEEESEKEPKEASEENVQPDDHCYGDSMPLSSSSLYKSFVFSSEIAQYDSNADPSSAPKKKQQQNDSNDTESQNEQKQPKKQTNIQDSEGPDVELSSHSGHSKFEMPSNDNDFATYEEFISSDENNQQHGAQPGGGGHGGKKQQAAEDEEEVYYEYEDEPEPQNPNVEPTKPANDGEAEYSYVYEDEEPENQGFFHPSPQPLNNSLKQPLDADEDYDELSF